MRELSPLLAFCKNAGGIIRRRIRTKTIRATIYVVLSELRKLSAHLRREMIRLPEIEIRKGESFESALRRFKRQIEHEGILKEIRERKHYEKPSERKRKRARRRK